MIRERGTSKDWSFNEGKSLSQLAPEVMMSERERLLISWKGCLAQD
jgi:hypothetical protein